MTAAAAVRRLHLTLSFALGANPAGQANRVTDV